MGGSRASPFVADNRSGQRSTSMPAPVHGLPKIVKCIKCVGRGSRGFFVCRSHCHCCKGTGEGSKMQLLELLDNMELGDVDAGVLLHAVSAEKRNDADIVLAAVGRFPKAIQFASDRLKANQEVIDTVAAADAALQKDMLNRSLSSQNNSHVSTGATALATCRLDEVLEEAAEWCSFSEEKA